MRREDLVKDMRVLDLSAWLLLNKAKFKEIIGKFSEEIGLGMVDTGVIVILKAVDVFASHGKAGADAWYKITVGEFADLLEEACNDAGTQIDG